MIEVRVGGIPMDALGDVDALEWSHGWPGGCLAASWSMAGLDRRTLPQPIRRGASVVVGEHGWPLWRGTLDEFEGVDRFTASGLSKAAERFPCADGSGAPTVDIGGAIGIQVANGLPWVNDPVAFATAPTGLGATEGDYLTLAAALDAATTAAGKRWGVDERGRFFVANDPTTPRYHTHVPVLGRADDSYFTHLIGRFVDAADAEGNPTSYDTVTRADTVAAARPEGPSYRIVDLTEYGVMTAVTADGVLAQLLNLGGSRVGFTERIEVATSDLLRSDGSPAYLPVVKAGDVVRLHGALAPESTYTGQAHGDIVIAETTYTHGSGRIVLAPVGLEARTLPDIIKAL